MTLPLPTVAILAGGLATRLRPITETIPKALVPVAGRPFLAHQLRLLAGQGFQRVVLCVGHLGEQIEAAFGTGGNYGIHLDYSYDGEKLVGTAGALRKALPLLGESFQTLYGDSYLDIDYRPIWSAFLQNEEPALMTVIQASCGGEPANVRFESNRVTAYGKKHPLLEMTFIDYGLNCFRSEVFQNFNTPDLSELQSELAQRDLLAGFEVTDPYFEIGSHRGLEALESHLKGRPNAP